MDSSGFPARERKQQRRSFMPKKLTKKQELFVAEYLVDLNATRAAMVAGYSEKTAKAQGSRLLTNVDVSEAIAAKHGKRLTNLEITADRVLQEIAKLAFHDPRKFYESDGSLKRIQDIDDDTAMALAGMEVTELFEGTGDEKHCYGLLKKIKHSEKRASLELLGKHLKLFGDAAQAGINGKLVVEFITSIPRPKRDEEP
jgi:phage terminase small subunit